MQHIEYNIEQRTSYISVTYKSCTQYICKDTEYNNMQHIEEEREQHTENREQDTEQRTEHSTDNLYTYSFDLYHEYVAIKNSDTIELYTISK